MNELSGKIKVSKRIRNHPVWLREPASYGQAWIDLLLLANDQPRRVVINGESIELKRGQLAWSIRTLEREWNRSRDWIDRFLQFCKDETMLLVDSTRRRTVITILNYEAYQTSEPQTDLETEHETEHETAPPTVHQQKVELGIGRGNSDPLPVEIPSDADVEAFCRDFKDLQRGIEGIPEVWWSGWVASRVSMQSFPRDWKRALVLAHRSDWLNPGSPGHAKARFNISANAQNASGEKKPARERGEILQELSLAQKNGATAEEIAALKEELKNAR